MRVGQGVQAVSTDLIVYLLLGGMLGRLFAMWAEERERRKREEDRKRLDAVMPPATSSFYPWNRQGRARHNRLQTKSE